MQRIKEKENPVQEEEEVTRGYLLGATAVGCSDLASTAGQSDSKKKDDEDDDDDDDDDLDEEMAEGLTAKQKAALGFVWFVSGVYAMMAREILSKERDVPCSIR